jgi:zinc transport system permease protein
MHTALFANAVTEVFQYDFLRRALIAAVLVGITAPAVGVFLVQRRLALIGDGLGHVAVTGLALGLVLHRTPVLVAVVIAVLGAVAIEIVRAASDTTGEIALAVLFYGGIAGGVVLVSKAPSGSRNLTQYLFGTITTTSNGDLVVFAILAAVVLIVVLFLGPALFAVSNDEEFARALGIPVMGINILLATLTALTVVVSMRVVGVLLVSALMVVPVATAQLFASSFRSTCVYAGIVAVVSAVVGIVVSYAADLPSGGTIVLVAIGFFVLSLVGSSVQRLARRTSAHGSS